MHASMSVLLFNRRAATVETFTATLAGPHGDDLDSLNVVRGGVGDPADLDGDNVVGSGACMALCNRSFSMSVSQWRRLRMSSFLFLSEHFAASMQEVAYSVL